MSYKDKKTVFNDSSGRIVIPSLVTKEQEENFKIYPSWFVDNNSFNDSIRKIRTYYNADEYRSVYMNFNFNCLDPKPTEKEIEQFLQLTRSLPADLVEYALKQTIAYCRQPTLNYAATIIMNFEGKGIDTLSKAKAWETNRVHQDELEAMDLPKIPIFKLADQPKGDNQ